MTLLLTYWLRAGDMLVTLLLTYWLHTGDMLVTLYQRLSDIMSPDTADILLIY